MEKPHMELMAYLRFFRKYMIQHTMTKYPNFTPVSRYSSLFSWGRYHPSHRKMNPCTGARSCCRHSLCNTARTDGDRPLDKQPSTHRRFHNSPKPPISSIMKHDLYPSARPHRKVERRQAWQRSNGRKGPLGWISFQYRLFSLQDVLWNMDCRG